MGTVNWLNWDACERCGASAKRRCQSNSSVRATYKTAPCPGRKRLVK